MALRRGLEDVEFEPTFAKRMKAYSVLSGSKSTMGSGFDFGTILGVRVIG